MRMVLALATATLCATAAITQAQDDLKGLDSLIAPQAPFTAFCGMDGTCRYDLPSSRQTLGTTILGSSTTTLAARILPTELDYVKAAAIIRWRARDESGQVRRAMERAAELMETCAEQVTASVTTMARLEIDCK